MDELTVDTIKYFLKGTREFNILQEKLGNFLKTIEFTKRTLYNFYFILF